MFRNCKFNSKVCHISLTYTKLIVYWSKKLKRHLLKWHLQPKLSVGQEKEMTLYYLNKISHYRKDPLGYNNTEFIL